MVEGASPVQLQCSFWRDAAPAPRTENTRSTRGTRRGTIFWYEAFSKPFSRGNGLELYKKKRNSSLAHCLKHTVSLEHEPSMNSFCRLRFLLQSHPMPKPRPQPPSAWSHYSSFSLLKETDPALWPLPKRIFCFHQTPRNASPFTTHPDYQRSFCLPSHRFCRSLNDLWWFPNPPATARLFVAFKYHFVWLLQLLTVPKIQPGAATEKPKTWHHHQVVLRLDWHHSITNIRNTGRHSESFDGSFTALKIKMFPNKSKRLTLTACRSIAEPRSACLLLSLGGGRDGSEKREQI